MNSTVKTPWKKAIKVWADNDNNYRLHLTMEDGENFELDLTPLLNSRDVFWRLKAFRYFRQVAIDPLGGLYWPEGEDICPTKMLDYVHQKSTVINH
jgi:hypothetical protein